MPSNKTITPQNAWGGREGGGGAKGAALGDGFQPKLHRNISGLVQTSPPGDQPSAKPACICHRYGLKYRILRRCPVPALIQPSFPSSSMHSSSAEPAASARTWWTPRHPKGTTGCGDIYCHTRLPPWQPRSFCSPRAGTSRREVLSHQQTCSKSSGANICINQDCLFVFFLFFGGEGGGGDQTRI